MHCIHATSGTLDTDTAVLRISPDNALILFDPPTRILIMSYHISYLKSSQQRQVT